MKSFNTKAQRSEQGKDTKDSHESLQPVVFLASHFTGCPWWSWLFSLCAFVLKRLFGLT
jgi:hypothetical protein